MNVVAETGEVTVDALALRFDVSAETIRRDLAQLAETGALQKVHGGARRLCLHAEGSYGERMTQDAGAKAGIAQKLTRLVAPGDTLFIDTGTTTLTCAEALTAVDGLTVITDSLHVAQALGRSRNRVFLLGGEFSADSAETVMLGQASLLADQPEFATGDRLRQIIELTETRQHLTTLLQSRAGTPGLSITIGNEHGDPKLEGFTVVTAEYSAGALSGVIGVIGPTRMPYDKVIALVGHTSQLVSDMLC